MQMHHANTRAPKWTNGRKHRGGRMKR